MVAATPPAGTVDVGQLVAAAVANKLTVATAESLTAGQVAATLAQVPGASAMLQGGVVAYQNTVKESLLGVSPVLLAKTGAVDSQVAAQMALGACKAVGARVGISTTGVAGPDPHQGKPVGLVYIGLALDGEASAREFHFTGDREEIRNRSTAAALELLAEAVEAAREQNP